MNNLPLQCAAENQFVKLVEAATEWAALGWKAYAKERPEDCAAAQELARAGAEVRVQLKMGPGQVYAQLVLVDGAGTVIPVLSSFPIERARSPASLN